MTASDGHVSGTTKVVDHGGNNVRWNLVIIGDGYRATELAQYHTDVQNFLTRFRTTPPFDELFCGINVHRIDVVSTDSGADDPGCAGGTAITASTYFDATFCTPFAGTPLDRLLTVDTTLAMSVATSQVPLRHQVLCIVNSSKYGGSGGRIATCSTHAKSTEIAIHEIGHSAFGLADEYGGNGAGTPAGEPPEPNVTRNTNRTTNKWRALVLASTPMPSACDSSCTSSTCVSPATPPAPGAVGTYEGAVYSDCNTYRPLPDCYMRDLTGKPFCPVCSGVIRRTLQPYLPAGMQRCPIDFGFAPGSSLYDYYGRVLLARLPNTSVINRNDTQNVETFINHLDHNPGIAKPIGDLLIISRGNSSGYMEIDLDSTSTNPDGTNAAHITYEVLEQAVASNSVRIPTALHASEPAPVQFDVHIRGSRIGKSPPFLLKLKEAFSSPRSVTAPKHTNWAGGFGTRRNITSWGSFEYMGYSFELFRHPNTRFRSKAEAVNAFDNHGFRYIENGGVAANVPRNVWEDRIPSDLKTRKDSHFVNFGRDVGRGITRVRLPHEFRHIVESFTFTIRNIATNPGNAAARELMLRETIMHNAQFQAPPDHLFPIYMRYGYESVDDFLEGFFWVCNWQQNLQQLVCVGSRHVYTVVVPVVDPGTQNLLFNLFPSIGSELIHVINLSPTDDRLFLRVT